MEDSPVQFYLDTLLAKALDEAAERIEFLPGTNSGRVRYFERHDLCHETELPADLMREMTERLLELAHMKLTAEKPAIESWLSFDDATESCRVHIAAQPGEAGTAVRLSF